MANDQDAKIDAIIASLTGEGGMFAVQPIMHNGREYPVISTAPPQLAAFFEAMCAMHHDKIFVVDGEQRLTFAEIYAQARALAAAFVSVHGVKQGDRVGIAARNSACWVVIYMAIIMAGGVATLLNGFWQGNEMVDAINDTDVSIVCADGPRAKRLAGATLVCSAKIITFDDGLEIGTALAPLLAGASHDAELPVLGPNDLVTILFTSGSTGKSKGAYSTHRAKVQGTFNYITQTVALLQYVTALGLAPKYPPSTLLNVPLFHITGEVTVFLQSFAMGRKMVMIPKWDAREAMRLIEAERVTYFTGVPLMSFEIMTHPDRSKFDLSSCTVFAAGGAARATEHVRRMHEEMNGGEPIAGYGLTETNAVGCSTFGDNYLAKPASTGRASPPLVELAILDDLGRPVATGERGEVCIRTICNFEGYWDNPEATAAAFTADQFFRTGDIGRVDDEGYLFIIDRKKDIIIRGGENITCLEVEAAIYTLPIISAACVFGLPDERFGEIPAAVVTLQPSANATPEGLQAELGKLLAAFKVPARIWISETPLPVLGTGKIDKVGIRRDYQARYAQGL